MSKARVSGPLDLAAIENAVPVSRGQRANPDILTIVIDGAGDGVRQARRLRTQAAPGLDSSQVLDPRYGGPRACGGELPAVGPRPRRRSSQARLPGPCHGLPRRSRWG